MKTITIPDPAEVRAAIEAEFPSLKYPSAFFACDHHWNLGGWAKSGEVFGLGESVQGRALTVEAALEALREQIAAADPLAKLRAQAEAAGMKLVPNE